MISLTFSLPSSEILVLRELTTVGDGDRGRGDATTRPKSLHGSDNFHALHDLAKDSVLAIEPGTGDGGDKKLAAVGWVGVRREGGRASEGRRRALVLLGPALAMERRPGLS